MFSVLISMARKQAFPTSKRPIDAPVLKAHPKAAATLTEALADLGEREDNFLVRQGIDAASLEIGLALKRARTKTGMTQERLSKKSGVPQGAISEIEHGKGKDGPSYRTVRLLADALGVEIAIKPPEKDGERAQRVLRTLARNTALVLVDVAGAAMLGSLTAAILDEKMMAKISESVRALLAKGSARRREETITAHAGALWRLAAHESAKLAIPEPTLYVICEGPAEIMTAKRLAKNVIVAAPNESVSLANTGTQPASVLTVPVGGLGLTDAR